ncbi:MAG: hypothetical protein V4538_07970 [Bacteroidota bacterium]
MKKITLILVAITLTAAFGMATVYLRTSNAKQLQNDPIEQIATASFQAVEQDNSTLAIPVDTSKVAQSRNSDDCFTYECAYQQYLAMLEGKKPLDFKRAVFIYENTYLKGALDYAEFSNHFTTVAQKLNDYINKKGIASYKTAAQYAIFSYMYEPSYLNDSQVFKYDFNDFLGDKDWTNMFVSKVMKTKMGNCHGLPYYYKLLSNELKAESFLAIAPNHMYIKHIDENGKWVNIELTNGHLSSDAWMISSMGISAEAIKKGIYMDGLSEKESIALCLWDLVMGYEKDNGYDDFVLKCCNTVIKYYPTCITALMTKQNCLQFIGKKQQAEAKKKGIKKNTPKMIATYKQFKALNQQIKKLGYREMPQDLYEQWIKSVENEKQNTTTNNKN